MSTPAKKRIADEGKVVVYTTSVCFSSNNRDGQFIMSMAEWSEARDWIDKQIAKLNPGKAKP